MSEAVLSRLRCLQPSVERALKGAAGSIELLERLYGFYAPLEARLSPFAHWTPLAWSRRKKAPLLAEDLWNLSDEDIELEMIPLCGELPDLSAAPGAGGAVGHGIDRGERKFQGRDEVLQSR